MPMEDINTTELPIGYRYNITCLDPDLVLDEISLTPGERSKLQPYLNLTEVVSIYISAAFIIFGLLGNIVSFQILHRMKSSASLILKALAIADSIYLLIMIMHVYDSFFLISSGNVFNNRMSYAIFAVCMRPLTCIVQTASTWLIVLVTVGRYLAVKKPVQAKEIFTEKRVKVAISLICMLSICLYVPLIFESFFWETLTDFDCRQEIQNLQNDLFYYNETYYLSYRVIIEGSIRFIIPLTVLIVLNSILAIGIRKAQKQRSVMMANGITSGQRQSDSITAMVVIVVTIFVMCQAPYIFFVIVRLSYRLDPPVVILSGLTLIYLDVVSNFFLILNSSVNFIIYVAVGKTFRQKLFRCCRRRSSDSLHV